MDPGRRSSPLSIFMTSSNSPPLYSRGLTDAVFTSFRHHKAGLSAPRFVAVVGPCVAFCVLVLLIAPWIGSTGVTWRNVFAGVSPDREIFVVARLPRILFGAVVGGSLAVGGGLVSGPFRDCFTVP